MTLREYRAQYGDAIMRRVARFRTAAKRDEVAAKKLLQEAEYAMQGLLCFNGTRGERYFVGNPPRWHEILNDDPEYIFTLNRMPHWKTLIQAYVLTGEIRYAEKVCAELASWIAHCPPPFDEDGVTMNIRRFHHVNGWRILEIGIRMFDTWKVLLEFLPTCDAFTEDLFDALLASVRVQARALMEVAPQWWPNADHNHYLHEMQGLFHAGCLYSFLPESVQWRDFAVGELCRLAQNLFSADGGEIEGSPHYHNLCVFMLTNAMKLAREHDVALPPLFAQRVEKGLAYAVHFLRANGEVTPAGDADIPVTSCVLAAGGYRGISGDGRYLDAIAALIGEDALQKELAENLWYGEGFQNYRPGGTLPNSLWYHDRGTKQAMLRTAWRKDALGLYFSAGGLRHPNHAHVDPLSLDFTAYGKALVTDPGRFCYKDSEECLYFRRANVHNCLLVNGEEPYQYRPNGSFDDVADSEITQITQTPRILAAAGYQKNYAPLLHRRAAAILEEHILIVLDAVDGLTAQEICLHFHLDTTDASLAENSLLADFGEVKLCAAWETEFSAGISAKLCAGWVSPGYDLRHESRRLWLRARGKSSFLTVFVPSRGEYAAAPRELASRIADGRVHFSFCVGEKGYRGALEADGTVRLED